MSDLPHVRRRPSGRRLPPLGDRMTAPEPLTTGEWGAAWAYVYVQAPNLPLTARLREWADYTEIQSTPTPEGDPA